MAFDNNQRQKFTGNWTCSKCGGSITELPFEPSPERLSELSCFDCFKKNRPQRDRGPREMFKGDWSCSMCGKAITELPFEPDPARVSNLKCFDCHKNSR